MFLETLKGDAANRFSRIFVRPERVITCRRDRGAGEFLADIDRARGEGMFVAGYLSYEFGYLLEEHLTGRLNRNGARPLAELGLFRKPIIIDHHQPESSPRPWDDTAVLDFSHTVAETVLNIGREDYLEDIGRIKGFIESGDTYQVNYTLKYRFSFQGSPLSLYRKLRRRQSVAYAALIRNGSEWIISLSPELFFRIESNTCTVKPMKGTCGRGRTLAEDRKLAEALAADEKNRSENVMIVDLLRNDLGRLCVDGGVRTSSMFDVEPFETLQQMTSTVTGKLAPGLSSAEVIRALFPCGSVTGAPKLRTMEIIADLEREERGVYTGAIGYWAPSGDCCFNVPIRTAVVRGRDGEMGIGSGIVYDSDPESEWRECLLKGNFLTGKDEDFSLIETMLYRKGSGFLFFEEHLGRLRDSAEFFNFSCDPEAIQNKLASLADELSAADEEHHRVRLLLDRDGGVSISHAPCGAPCLAVDPEAPPRARVAWADRHTDSASRFLYHKTTCRGIYDQGFRQAGESGLFDLLFTNERDQVTEGAISNIFVLKNGEILTPDLVCGLLPGVLRQKLLRDGLRTVAGEIIPVREAVLNPDDVEGAEAVFLGNSVRGLTRVVFR